MIEMHLYMQKDRANNQVYIGFAPDRAGLKGGAVKKTVQAEDDIALDFDSKGRLLGVDISNASRVLGRKVFDAEFSGDELVGVAEAAKLCRVKKPNFVRDFADRPDFPEPAVELASGRIWLRSDVEAYSRKPKQTSQAPSRKTIQPTGPKATKPRYGHTTEQLRV